jgi:hypothetical protein
MTLRKLIAAGILGMSLVGLSSLPTWAQDDATDTPYENMSDEDFKVPVRSMNYPMAAPGSLHLMHWHGYNHQRLMAGSVNDYRAERERRADRMYRETRETYWSRMSDAEKRQEEDWRAYPTAWEYPMAAPGSLHMMHWHGLDKQRWMEGSVNDMRYMTEMEKDKMWRDERNRVTWTDEELEMRAYPLAMDYTTAAPGSLHLYHWKDYRRYDILGGSVWETRMEQERRKDEMWMRERNMTGDRNRR